MNQHNLLQVGKDQKVLESRFRNYRRIVLMVR